MTTPDLFIVVADETWEIRVRGKVDGDVGVLALEEALDQAVAWGRGDVTLDLSGGVELGQAAIDAVIDARHALGQYRRRLIVVRDRP